MNEKNAIVQRKHSFPWFFMLTVFAVAVGHSAAYAQLWVNTGSAGFSADSAWYTSIAIGGDGIPYVVYGDKANSNKATVQKYNGTSWEVVGTAGFSAGLVEYTSIAIGKTGTPYVAYDDWGNGGKATVMKYNGSNWVAVGSPGFSAGKTWYMSLALGANDTPYVVYMDYSASDMFSNKAVGMKYNGTNWVSIGNTYCSILAANYTSIAMDTSGKPFVVFEDYNKNQEATVAHLNGNFWSTLGTEGFSAGEAWFTSIAIDRSNTPYVVYLDSQNNYKATVMKYSGASWTTVGSAGFSPDSAFYTSIAIDKYGTPYVVFQDDGSSEKATVMRFTDTGWASVGNMGFSPGPTFFNSIAMDSNGTPYVVFEDMANGGKISVMTPGPSAGVKSVVGGEISAIHVFPSPNNGSFTFSLTGVPDATARLVITNMLGEKVKELSIATNQKTGIHLDAPPGLYFISVTTNSENLAAKVELR